MTIMPTVLRSIKILPTLALESATTSGQKKRTARALSGFVVHEPFFQFIFLGLLFWGGVDYWNVRHSRYTIHLGPAERQRIAMTYRQQFGEMPTPQQFQALMERYIREEIFLREGLALNLEKDDEIVRRRIVQKYEFLQTDLAVTDSPRTGMLEDWFEKNQLRYLTPERVTFTQVFFSADKQFGQAAKVRALKVLKELRGLRASRAPSLGEVFPGPSDVGDLTPQEAARLFGQSELSEQLFKLPVGQWSGPYRSGFGWHLVYITGVSPPILPPLTDIHKRVLADYLEDQRRISNARTFEKMRAQYTIRYDGERR
jgi:peptidyl-prolyl cis-trans isomerase C